MNHLTTRFLGQELVVDLVGRFLQDVLLPQIRRQVRVGALDCIVGGLGEVPQSGCLSNGAGVAVIESGHLQELLGNGSAHHASATRSRNQTDEHRATFASHLQFSKVKVKVKR